jgi:hypothetical protein
MPFSDLLYGVAQGECRSNSAKRNKSEGGHKSIELTGPSASMPETVNGWQQNRQDEDDRNEIGDCES